MRGWLRVLLGHPGGVRSLNGALAEAYAEGARDAGSSVACVDLSEMAFDPDVREVSPRAQSLEPDLERLRHAIATPTTSPWSIRRGGASPRRA